MRKSYPRLVVLVTVLIKSTVRNSAVMLDNHVGEVNKCPLNCVVDVHYSDYLSILK